MNVKMCCKKCNSSEVSVKAELIWAPYYQQFVTADFIDDSWECRECGPTDVMQVEFFGAVETDPS